MKTPTCSQHQDYLAHFHNNTPLGKMIHRDKVPGLGWKPSPSSKCSSVPMANKYDEQRREGDGKKVLGTALGQGVWGGGTLTDY